MSLSPAAAIVLTRAAERPDHRLQFHRKLPTGGRHKMIDALLRDGLIVETLGDYRLGDASTLIEDAATGLMLTTLALTDAGLAAIGRTDGSEVAIVATPPHTDSHAAIVGAAPVCGGQSENAACESPVPATGMARSKRSLRAAAEALVAAWDGATDRDYRLAAMAEAVEALRSHLAARTPAPRAPRQGTKQASVLALLGRPDGTTITQIMDATGWAPHTVRGFLAGLKRKGTKVEPIDRVRQVGPNQQGAKGSYTIYRLGAV